MTDQTPEDPQDDLRTKIEEFYNSMSKFAIEAEQCAIQEEKKNMNFAIYMTGKADAFGYVEWQIREMLYGIENDDSEDSND